MKKLLTAIVFICAALTAYAQYSVTLTVPEYTSFLRVNTDGVNLRKTPNANSGKLMCWNSDGGSYFTEEVYFFSDENRGRYKANSLEGSYINTVHPMSGELMPILGESGDWYKVQYMYGTRNTSGKNVAWIMKKFGTRIDVAGSGLENFCPGNYEYDDNGSSKPRKSISTVNRSSGMFKDMRFGVDLSNDTESTEYYGTGVKIPLLINNKYLYVANCGITVKYNKNATSPRLYWEKEYGMDDEVFYHACLDVNKSNPKAMSIALRDFLLNTTEKNFKALIDSTIPRKNAEEVMELWVCSTSGEFIYVGANEVSNSPLSKITKTLTFTAGSNTAASSSFNDPEIVKPEFPGGVSALLSYLKKNTKYPEEAKKQGIKGRVVIGFNVDTTGAISDVVINKSAHPLLDFEAVRVIKSMPNWTPATKNGKKIKMKYTLPITFK